MSSRKVHCEETLKKLGNEWDCVHEWLDGLACKTNDQGVICLDTNHRIHRHNLEGVEYVREQWGDEAAKAAEIHIKQDMGQILPKDQMIYIYGDYESLVPWEKVFGK
jgi:hypothetical protein